MEPSLEDNFSGSDGAVTPVYEQPSEEDDETCRPQDTIEPDTAVPREEYNAAFFNAAMSIAPANEFRLPWEQGVFGIICGNSDVTYLNDPLNVPVLPAEFPVPTLEQAATGSMVARGPKRSLDLPLHATVVRALRDEDAFEQLDRLWNVAIAKWLNIFETLGFPGAVGTAILVTGVDVQQANVILRDTLGIRSPRTAIKRALTVQRFMNWMKASGHDMNSLNRSHILDFLTPVGDKNVAPSAGTSLLEAFRFCHFVLDISFPTDVLRDPQILGRVQRLRVTGNYDPARDLLTCEVAMLERTMGVLTDPCDVYLLGCCLFALYSRSRWSDLQHLQTMWIERHEVSDGWFGFVEARTRFHKTGSSMERKLRYMPLVAPISGITDTDWTDLWMNSMWHVGFDFKAQPVGALCRAPLHGGGLAQRSMTSDEIGDFLNRVLNTDNSNKVKSHSLKHTTLAWCAKYGIGENSRTLLGHHELPGRSCAVYSRDLLTRPLQKYCAMLMNIRSGSFLPDSSRAVWMGIAEDNINADGVSAPNLRADTEEEDEGNEVESVVQESSGEEINSVSSDESSSYSDASDAEAVPALLNERASDDCDIPGPVWVNIRSKTVHKVGSAEDITACGRRVAKSNFSYLELGTTSLNPRCTFCYRHDLIVSKEQMADHLEALANKRVRRQVPEQSTPPKETPGGGGFVLTPRGPPETDSRRV